MKNKVIVFGNAHHNTLGLVRSLGEKGIRPILLLEPCDLKFCCVRFSKYISKMHYLKSVEDGLEVLKKEYWNEKEKPVVLNAGDPSICLLDAHYDELKDHFHIFNANGEQGRINYFMDKSNQFQLAERCGLNLIKTWRVNSQCELPSDMIYPCLTKGNNSTGSGKGDMCICRNVNELKACLRDGVDYLVQEYVERDYELCAIGFSWNHGQDMLVPAIVRKIRDYVNENGIPSEGSYMRLESLEDYPLVNLDAIRNFMQQVGYEGMFDVDFIVKDGVCYFLEVNFRNDAISYICTAAGVDLPYMWCCYCLGGIDDGFVAKIKCNTPFIMMNEDNLYDVFDGKVGMMRWLREYLSADAHVYMNVRDPKPFLFYMWVHVRQMCKKIVRGILAV